MQSGKSDIRRTLVLGTDDTRFRPCEELVKWMILIEDLLSKVSV